jgi:hypothetical protein
MIGSGFVGGLLGTLVLTTAMRVASEVGWTRMDLAFILGTVVTDDRRRARAIGYLIHVMLGLVFAFAYDAVFRVLGWSAWWLGALFGAVHAVFISTVIVNVLLPVVHPLMGTPETAANEFALIEPPGFLLINYGRNTFFVTLVAHVLFGAIVGGTYAP